MRRSPPRTSPPTTRPRSTRAAGVVWRSLDALRDCLSDIHEETEVRLIGADELVARLGAYAVALQTMLHDACAENPRLRFVTEEKEA